MAVLVGIAIAAVGVSRLVLPAEDDLDPRGFAVLDRPQTAAEREIDVSLVGKLEKRRVHREDARLLSGDADHYATLIPIRRTSTQGSPRSGLLRFDQVCLSYGASLSFVSCGDAAELLRGEVCGATTSDAISPSEPSPLKPPPTHFFGLVPNAVARVEVTFSGRIPSLKAEVNDNYYDVVSANPEAVNRVGATRWFDADGRAVRH